MQIALLATVLVAMVWLVALRPKPARQGDTASAPVTPAQPAPSASETGGTAAATPSKSGTSAAAAGSTSETAKPKANGGGQAKAARSSDPNVRLVRSALRQRKAIAIAFVTSQASDARAVAQELRHVGNFSGRAVTLSVPIKRLSRYGFITRGIGVSVAPTIVIVAPNREATTIVGFADRSEIKQRIDDVLVERH